jgi:hypothetical protein
VYGTQCIDGPATNLFVAATLALVGQATRSQDDESTKGRTRRLWGG